MTMPPKQFPTLVDRHDAPMGVLWFLVLLLVAWSWGWEIDLRAVIQLAALAWGCMSVIVLVRFVGRYIAYRWG
ncbi:MULTISPECIES: hypothetical protein [unclassified Nocardiopsis]|uniref:hypothetical protein n=1 Tax=Nocardiopsis TaxID=2013 RepID=UPI00387B4C6A